MDMSPELTEFFNSTIFYVIVGIVFFVGLCTGKIKK